jgi:hypothetical protein
LKNSGNTIGNAIILEACWVHFASVFLDWLLEDENQLEKRCDPDRRQ